MKKTHKTRKKEKKVTIKKETMQKNVNDDETIE